MSRSDASRIYLLDANVLIALTDTDHVSHRRATDWFVRSCRAFATCPVTEGALVRFLLRARPQAGVASAKAFISAVQAVKGHRFWPDSISYADLPEHGIVGHRQVTDAYLAALAAHHQGALATLDKALANLYPTSVVLID